MKGLEHVAAAAAACRVGQYMVLYWLGGWPFVVWGGAARQVSGAAGAGSRMRVGWSGKGFPQVQEGPELLAEWHASFCWGTAVIVHSFGLNGVASQRLAQVLMWHVTWLVNRCAVPAAQSPPARRLLLPETEGSPRAVPHCD